MARGFSVLSRTLAQPAVIVLVTLGYASCAFDDGRAMAYYPPITEIEDAAWDAMSVPTFGSDDRPADTSFLSRRMGRALPIGLITAIDVVGSYVVLADRFADPKIAVLDLRSGELVARFGRPGEGPGEFRVPHSFAAVSTEPPRVWVYDFGNQRLTLLALDHPRESMLLKELRLDVGAQLMTPKWVGGRILSNGLLLDYTLLVLDPGGRPLARIRGDPPFDASAMPLPHGRLILNLNRMAADRDRRRFVLAYQHTDRIDIFDGQGRRLRSMRGPRSVTTDFRVDAERRVVRRPNSRRAYVAATATDRFIYLLFCGLCSYERAPSLLHVFDWSGRFVAELAISPGILALAVSPDDSLLIGSYGADEFEPRLGEWVLPGFLRDREPSVAHGSMVHQSGTKHG